MPSSVSVAIGWLAVASCWAMPLVTASLKLPPVPWAWTTSGQPPAGAAPLGTVSAKQTWVEPCWIGVRLKSV